MGVEKGEGREAWLYKYKRLTAGSAVYLTMYDGRTSRI